MCDLNFLNIERVPVPVMKELGTLKNDLKGTESNFLSRRNQCYQ